LDFLDPRLAGRSGLVCADGQFAMAISWLHSPPSTDPMMFCLQTGPRDVREGHNQRHSWIKDPVSTANRDAVDRLPRES
jgi:hypothetical protein